MRWLVVIVFFLGINSSTMAEKTVTGALTVSVQVLEKGSVNKTTVRGISEDVKASYAGSYLLKPTNNNYSIPFFITVGRASSVTITGKIDNSLPAGSTLYIRLATQEMAGQNDIRLLTTEQELICKLTEQGEGYRLITYPFQYTIRATAEVIEEIQLTKPIMVILTIYY
jgi:hypothetical protein